MTESFYTKQQICNLTTAPSSMKTITGLIILSLRNIENMDLHQPLESIVTKEGKVRGIVEHYYRVREEEGLL